MEARCEINRFVQAVAALTPCSPQLPSSFLTLSSCRLPTCSQRHFGYFFLFLQTAKPPPPPPRHPLFPHHISFSFHCLCSYHLSVELNPFIQNLIQGLLSA